MESTLGFKEFYLFSDEEWENLYHKDEEYLKLEKFRNFVVFQEKTYVLFHKHIICSKFLESVFQKDITLQTFDLKLKYCVNPIAFDYFMKILYGMSPRAKVPNDYVFDVILIILELGINNILVLFTIF